MKSPAPERAGVLSWEEAEQPGFTERDLGTRPEADAWYDLDCAAEPEVAHLVSILKPGRAGQLFGAVWGNRPGATGPMQQFRLLRGRFR